MCSSNVVHQKSPGHVLLAGVRVLFDHMGHEVQVEVIILTFPLLACQVKLRVKDSSPRRQECVNSLADI